MRSDALKKGPSRAPARAMLKGTGLTDADLERPLVAIVSTWTDVMPCTMHLRHLAEKVRAGIRAAGGTPIEFNTIAVSDGITMGTEGMRASLVSREVIADSIELAVAGHLFDACVVLVGCDKTIPAAAMAVARVDVPSVILYGGPIHPGRFRDRDVTIQDVFEAVGACAAGKMSESELVELEGRACPGAGACGGQYTANTMSAALSVLGLSPLGANDVPATDPVKDDVAFASGQLVMRLLASDLRPSALLTRTSLENAITICAATGGSTNAVLHLLAIACEAGIPLAIDDFDVISARTPVIADLKPGGSSRRSISTAREGSLSSSAAWPKRASCETRPSVSGPSLFDAARARRRTRRTRRNSASSAPSRRRSSRAAASRSCAERSRRRGAW